MNNNIENKDTIDLANLLMQLKDAYDILSEREEELELWRRQEEKFMNSQKELHKAQQQLADSEKLINDLKKQIAFLNQRDNQLLNSHMLENPLHEAYSTLFKQYAEAKSQIDILETLLEDTTIKYNGLLPHIERMSELEGSLALALKVIDDLRFERENVFFVKD